MDSAYSLKVPRASSYSGSRLLPLPFAYTTLTSYGRSFQYRSARLGLALCGPKPHGARTMVWAPSISLAATLEIDFSFFSSGYLDVSVHRVTSCTLWIHVQVHEDYSCRLPHSEISGSKAICASPKLIAACHVLHRLLVPRHPPCALHS